MLSQVDVKDPPIHFQGVLGNSAAELTNNGSLAQRSGDLESLQNPNSAEGGHLAH